MSSGKSSMTAWRWTLSNKKKQERKAIMADVHDAAVDEEENEPTRQRIVLKILRFVIALSIWMIVIPWEFIVYFYCPKSVVYLKYSNAVFGLMLIYSAIVLGAKQWLKSVLLGLLLPFRPMLSLKRMSIRSAIMRLIYIIKMPMEVMVMVAASRIVTLFTSPFTKIALVLTTVTILLIAYDVESPGVIKVSAVATFVLGVVYIGVLVFGYWTETKIYNKLSMMDDDYSVFRERETHELMMLLYFLKATIKLHNLNDESWEGRYYQAASRLLYLALVAISASYVPVKMLFLYAPWQYSAIRDLQYGDVLLYVLSALGSKSIGVIEPVGTVASFLDVGISSVGFVVFMMLFVVVAKTLQNAKQESMRNLSKRIIRDIERLSTFIFKKENRSVGVIVQEIMEGGDRDGEKTPNNVLLRKLISYVDKI